MTTIFLFEKICNIWYIQKKMALYLWSDKEYQNGHLQLNQFRNMPMTKTATTTKIRYVPIFENRQWPIVCAILHCQLHIPIILDIVKMLYISFKLFDYLALINIL